MKLSKSVIEADMKLKKIYNKEKRKICVLSR